MPCINPAGERTRCAKKVAGFGPDRVEGMTSVYYNRIQDTHEAFQNLEIKNEQNESRKNYRSDGCFQSSFSVGIFAGALGLTGLIAQRKRLSLYHR